MIETKDRKPDEPYCRNCGYVLSGLTESSKCPECGRPLVEVLTRAPTSAESGRRYRSNARIFGMPVIHIAFGARHGEIRGRARGFIAMGDDAVGVLAIGGRARGVVAVGGLAVGGFSIGGFSLGLVTALGGGAIGGVAAGGGALGGIAKGGAAVGIVADGGAAVGIYARGGGAFGRFPLGGNPGASAPEAVEAFASLQWLLGSWPPGLLTMLQTMIILAGVTGLAAGVISVVALRAWRKDPGEEGERG